LMNLRLIYSSILLCIGLQATGQQANTLISGKQPNHVMADSLDVLARRYMLNSKQDSARILLDKAIEYALASNNPTIIARCYLDYANMYNLRSRFSESEHYLALAKPYLALTDHYEVGITGLLLQAHVFNITGRKDSAIYYYRAAERFNQERRMDYRNYVVYMSLGELYNQLGDFPEAEQNYEEAYRITVAKEGKPDHGYVLLVYINYHLNRNKAEGAGRLIAEYDALVEERKKNKFDDPLKNVIMNVTGGRLETNIGFMKEVREESLRNKEMMHALIADVYITRYYEKRKNYGEAIRYISEAEQFAAGMTSVDHLYEARKMKFELLKKAGRYDEASELATTLFDLKDSLLTLSKREQLYELEKRFGAEKKQKEIQLLTSQKELGDKTIALLTSDKKLAALMLQQELLNNKGLQRENELMDSIVKSEQAVGLAIRKEKEKQQLLNAALDRENDLKASQLKKEKNIKWLLAGGIGLLLLSGVAILALYRRQQRKSAIIEKQAADLEVLMKEIHHRVKNNLQIVSSLLDLQSHYITDHQASEAVKEGKNRVQSMALIHQNLYSEGNIKGIRVKEYISNLLQTLCSSYNISNDQVRITANIDNINLDVDTMIPIGLVLNELVTNAFKYAFREAGTGELEILLKASGDKLKLLVKDNGTGFPAGMDLKNSKSFGLKMIRAFAQKLKARLDIYNNEGAVVEMEISKFKTA